MKEQDNPLPPEKELNEMEISNLPSKEFKVMAIRCSSDLINSGRTLTKRYKILKTTSQH